MPNFDLKTLLDSLKENVIDPYKRKLNEVELQNQLNADEQIGTPEETSSDFMNKLNKSVSDNTKQALSNLPNIANVPGTVKINKVNPSAAESLAQAKSLGQTVAVKPTEMSIGKVTRVNAEAPKPSYGSVKLKDAEQGILSKDSGTSVDEINQIKNSWFGDELAKSKKFDSPEEYMSKNQARFNLIKDMLLKNK